MQQPKKIAQFAVRGPIAVGILILCSSASTNAQAPVATGCNGIQASSENVAWAVVNGQVQRCEFHPITETVVCIRGR